MSAQNFKTARSAFAQNQLALLHSTAPIFQSGAASSVAMPSTRTTKASGTAITFAKSADGEKRWKYPAVKSSEPTHAETVTPSAAATLSEMNAPACCGQRQSARGK